MTLDGGTLRFENTTAVRFANAFVGAGTVALAGVAPVTFTGDMSRCQDRLLDLVGTAQTFTELPPFGSITNSSSAVATIRLAQNLGMVSWDGRRLSPSDKIGLEIATGTILDLGGKTLTVRRLAGDRSQIVNGELVETNPRRGLMLLVR